MATSTPNLGLLKPSVNDPTDEDLWGGQLNDDMDILDTQVDIAQRFISSSVSGAFTVVLTDKHKQFNCTAGADYTITLPTAATALSGFTVAFKKTDATAFVVIIDGAGTETIDGALTYTLSGENQSVVLVCDGANWKVQAASIDKAAILNNSALTGIPTAPTAAAGTNTTQVATTAFVQQENPIKAFAVITGASGALVNGRGVSAVVRNSVGNYTLTFSPALSSANYAVQLSFGSSTVIDGSNGTFFRVNTGVKTTTSLQILSTINGGAGDPTQLYVSVIL